MGLQVFQETTTTTELYKQNVWVTPSYFHPHANKFLITETSDWIRKDTSQYIAKQYIYIYIYLLLFFIKQWHGLSFDNMLLSLLLVLVRPTLQAFKCYFN